MSDKNIYEKINNILMTSNVPSKELNEVRKTLEFKESVFNVINKLEEIEQDKKFHPEGNVWNHTIMVVDTAAALKEFSKDEKSLLWAALLHDLGKIPTTKWIRGKWRSYGHDTAGANMAKELLNKVSNDIEFNTRVENLVKFHMHHLYIVKELPFADIEGLKMLEDLNDIILIFLSDKLGRGEKTKREINMIIEELLSTIKKIESLTKRDYESLKENLSNIYLGIKD